MKFVRVKVLTIVQETPDTKTFTLKYPGVFSFVPGQFVMIRLPGDPDQTAKRAYSIASVPNEQGTFQITFNLVPGGRMSSRLYNIKEGDELEAAGPFGNFTFSDKADILVFIGGGTGIAPLRCMLQYALQQQLPKQLVLLYTVRRPQDIIYRAELETLDQNHQNVTYYQTITRLDEAPWNGATGRITKERIMEVVSDPTKALFFLCGSPELVTAFKEMLQDLGVTAKQIQHEQW
ncbi:MAG: hypothetical protein KKA90_01185 [Nanoarchaeota archaeon]|nr:hypothetical protein [Nanoarchaeota archaeon]